MVLRSLTLILCFLSYTKGFAGDLGHAVNPPYDQAIINIETRRVDWLGRSFYLPADEIKLLVALRDQKGLALDYESLLVVKYGTRKDFIGNPDNIHARTQDLAQTISRLKTNFKKVDPTFDRIENYKGFGYRWRLDYTPLPPEPESLSLGDLVLHPKSFSVFWKGQLVDGFIAASFPVLQKLVARKDDGLKCAEVLKERNESFGRPDDNRLASNHISKIKKAFREKDPDFNCIKETYIESGYYWSCK